MHGGDLVATVIQAQDVQFVFTLCGGHISPILVGCKTRGIRVVDVRHEANAVFAADAVARLSGIPGVAIVTAGPGVTNTITAMKNAQLAQSPVVLIGGAAATALKGRGALQDIDQMVLMKPHVKWAKGVRRVNELVPTLEQAFFEAQKEVPGPVFVEIPVDLLYDESLVKGWYGGKSGGGKSLPERMLGWYLNRHVQRLFAGVDWQAAPSLIKVSPPTPQAHRVEAAVKRIEQAKTPLLVVGSQAVSESSRVNQIAEAVNRLGIPVYLSGMARGLMGNDHPLHMRHQRRRALKEADVVILAGVPNDFRLDYGRHIRRSAFLISANRSRREMRLNRRPNLGIHGDAGIFLTLLAQHLTAPSRWQQWIEHLREQDQERENEINRQAEEITGRINPLWFCRELESQLDGNSILVADGGDFVSTASYIVKPRAPLSWLDPGVFGTLGVGAGFALGAKLCRPDAEVWILYGDGSVAYSLAEFDTFIRHNIPVIAVVGNDAGWTQIAREQVEILKDDVGTVLRFADYHIAAKGFGGEGIVLTDSGQITSALRQAKQIARNGKPVLVNVHFGKTGFRKGSISM